MWYVIQTLSGGEDAVQQECMAKIDPKILESSMIFYYEEKIRYAGAWHTRKKKWFPGYVFLISENVEALYKELKQIPSLTRLLGTGDEIVPLTEEEVELLKTFADDEQTVRMSEGIIVGKRAVVTTGPLQGKEALIRKIDRHKRKAWLEMELFGRKQRIEVGLEIVRKIEETEEV